MVEYLEVGLRQHNCLMKFEKIVQICHPGVPALAGCMPAGTAAYCRASPIRLKPGLLKIAYLD